MQDRLADLTAAQREAVAHTEGPLLVVAGAGSGKTRVITRRIAHLIERGVDARSILAITFTNKAAGEMRERVEKLTSGAKVTCSTFHAFGARALRRWAEVVGRKKDFTILDDSDQLAAVREALVETGTDPKLYGAPKVLHAIGRAKDELRTPEVCKKEALSPFEKAVADAYVYYEELLRQNNAFDFGDLLARTCDLLAHEKVREALQDRYRYLLIDEYQDTNHAQYLMAKTLAGDRRNICATGDPNQAIYGWRGADIANILRFEEDYPDARVVKLEENFRSTPMVLMAANAVIKNNKERRDTTLRSGIAGIAEGDPLECKGQGDETEEGRFIARRAAERIAAGLSPREIAVFYRANALSRAIEVALLERGIPFEVVGAVSFYQRKEIKDVLAYLRLASNPDDDLALARVANVPSRHVGKATVARLKQHAKERGTSLWKAIEDSSSIDLVRGRAREGLRALAQTLRRLASYARGEPSVEEVLRTVLAETRYREFLTSEFPEDQEDRLMNVEGLLTAARDFDRVALASGLPRRPARAGEPEVAFELPPSRGEEEGEDVGNGNGNGNGEDEDVGIGEDEEEEEEAGKGEGEGKGKGRGREEAKPIREVEMSLFGDLLPPEPVKPAKAKRAAKGKRAEPKVEATRAAPAPVVVREPEPEPSFEAGLLDIEDATRPGVEGFLEHVALVSTLEQKQAEDEREKVQLMTVHTAKGLEFDTVFVAGLEDGIFPHSRALEDGGGLEEERRLFYVAVTRARKHLTLTRANWRMHQGRTTPQRPSMFLFELPDGVFEAGQSPREVERSWAIGDDQDDEWDGGWDARARRKAGPASDATDDGDVEAPSRLRALGPDDGVDPPAVDDDVGGAPRRPARKGGPRVPAPWSQPLARPGAPQPAAKTSGVGPLGLRVAAPKPRPEAGPSFRAGDRVQHEQFGRGVILDVRGAAHAARARVKFRDHGEKDLALQYARMTKVEA